jgi:hypothetical protein
MKALKSIMLGLALLVVSTVANALPNQTTGVLTKEDVLNTYVNAVIHGKIDGLESILSKDVQYVITRGEKEYTLDKKRILESFKPSENVEQGCTYKTSVMDETDKTMVVKLIMKYDTYVRTNLITISMNHSDFKITKIEAES